MPIMRRSTTYPSVRFSRTTSLYNPEEDRIFFRVNSTDHKEFRFWVTRRFAQLLLKVLGDHLVSDPDISLQGTLADKQAVMEFKKEKAMDGANFKQSFQEEEAEFPLGQEAQLAYKITSNKAGDNLQLGIHPKSAQGINMVINRDINTTMTQLLLGSARKAGWNLGVASRDETDTQSSGRQNDPIIN
ncbi:MAG: hypothetical protein CMQ17_02920 [Gammaproteobacteria bacterium]|nr:hypothetical protein [Gammaproteobacteria bacterium]